jgi:hypothetical protein
MEFMRKILILQSNSGFLPDAEYEDGSHLI